VPSLLLRKAIDAADRDRREAHVHERHPLLFAFREDKLLLHVDGDLRPPWTGRQIDVAIGP
jgi:hypothetical protein